MRSDRNKTIITSLFALVFALFATSLILAGEKAAKTGNQEVKQAVEQPVQQAADQLEAKPVESVQEATAGADEPPDGETDPLPEPEAVVKTKTKSNQSND